MKTKTPVQNVQLTTALRHLEHAVNALADAGESLAAMRVAGVLRGLK